VEFMAILLGCVTFQPLRVHPSISLGARQKARHGRVPELTNRSEWDAAHVADNEERSDLVVLCNRRRHLPWTNCCSHRFNEGTTWSDS